MEITKDYTEVVSILEGVLLHILRELPGTFLPWFFYSFLFCHQERISTNFYEFYGASAKYITMFLLHA
jgi:hypothetical protein